MEDELQKSFDCAAFDGFAQDDSILTCFSQFQPLIRIIMFFPPQSRAGRKKRHAPAPRRTVPLFRFCTT